MATLMVTMVTTTTMTTMLDGVAVILAITVIERCTKMVLTMGVIVPVIIVTRCQSKTAKRYSIGAAGGGLRSRRLEGPGHRAQNVPAFPLSLQLLSGVQSIPVQAASP